MYWLILLLAGVFEIAFAIGLKYSQGLTRLWPTAISGACVMVSMGLLALALRALPIGSAYAIWTGIGTIGTAVLGIALFEEPATAARLAFISMILAGVLGLRLVTP
jgi:quaternary ammonium compound-resistance protein SugE